jgi:hypothetical protein
VTGDAYVFDNRELSEQLRILESLDNAAGRDFVGSETAEVLALPANLAPSGRKNAGDHVHQRRLSRPVRAEDAHDFAFGNLECHVVDGYKTAKAFGHMTDFKHGCEASAVIRRCLEA